MSWKDNAIPITSPGLALPPQAGGNQTSYVDNVGVAPMDYNGVLNAVKKAGKETPSWRDNAIPITDASAPSTQQTNPVNGFESFAQGMKNATSFGLSDELEGFGTAVGQKLKGDQRPFNQILSSDINDQRTQLANAQAQNPYAALAGGAVGSILPAFVPGGQGSLASWLGRGGLAARAAKGAAVGAGTGGLQAFGNAQGNVIDRAIPTAEGTAGGAAIGGVLPFALSGLGSATNAVGSGKTALSNYVAGKSAQKGLSKAEAKAQNIFLEAAQNEGISPQDIADQLAQGALTGKPVVGLDYMSKELNGVDTAGRNFQGLAMAASRMPGKGAEIAANIAARSAPEVQADRISNLLDNALGKSKFYDVSADALDRMSKEAPPAYEKAFASGPVTSDKIQKLLQQPEIKAGIARGLKIQRIESAADGKPFDPNDYIINIKDNPTRMTQLMRAITGSENSISDMGDVLVDAVPNMRLLDAGKKGLDAMIADEKNPLTGKATEMGRALTKLKKSYVSELDNLNSDYAGARQVYGDQASRLQALDQGRKFQSQDPEEIAQFFKDPSTSDAEKQAYIVGAKRAIQDKLINPVDKTKALNKIINTEKLEPMFSNPKDYEDFKDSVALAHRMARTDALSQGNSITSTMQSYKDQIANGGQGLGKASLKALVNPKGAAIDGLTGVVDKGLRSRVNKLDQDTAEQLNKILYSDNPGTFSALQQLAQKKGITFQDVSALKQLSRTQNGLNVVVPLTYNGIRNRQ